MPGMTDMWIWHSYYHTSHIHHNGHDMFFIMEYTQMIYMSWPLWQIWLIWRYDTHIVIPVIPVITVMTGMLFIRNRKKSFFTISIKTAAKLPILGGSGNAHYQYKMYCMRIFPISHDNPTTYKKKCDCEWVSLACDMWRHELETTKFEKIKSKTEYFSYSNISYITQSLRAYLY